MKKCPFCAEDIQDAAVVCKHCGRDLVAGATKVQVVEPKKKTSVATLGCATIIVLVFVGWCASVMNSTTPKALTTAHRDAVTNALKARQLDQPSTLSLESNGFIVADYVISDPAVALRARTFGETRLIAIREALLPFGYQDYRVNVNGPPPGTGLIRRYGSARFIGAGGKVEWITP